MWLVARWPKRRLLWFLFGLALPLLLGLGAVYLAHGRHGITRHNFDRIEIGMTREQVIRLLGEDTDDFVSLGAGRHSAYYTKRSPVGGTTIIEVRYDATDQVFDKAFQQETFGGWWRDVRGRLGL